MKELREVKGSYRGVKGRYVFGELWELWDDREQQSRSFLNFKL